MNERMKELVMQATYTVKGANGCVWGDNVNLEKFAELIVRECAEEAFEFWCDQIDPSEQSAQDHILNYFGVE